jgi:Tn3 transposase DDE domain
MSCYIRLNSVARPRSSLGASPPSFSRVTLELATLRRPSAIQSLRGQGETVPDELLAHLAPVGWQHINLTGDYLWDTDASIGPGGFRPLRHAIQPRRAAA